MKTKSLASILIARSVTKNTISSICAMLLSLLGIAWASLSQAATQPSPTGVLPELSGAVKGPKIAFYGDLVTTWLSSGYAQQVIRGLEANGIKASLILVGDAGSSDKMLAHLDEKVIATKPDLMVLNCGVSDAWGNRSLDQYRQAMRGIVEKAQAAKIKVVIATATMADEDPSQRFNKAIAGYNTFLRELAQERKCLLADFDMPAAVSSAGGGAQSKRGRVLLVSDYVYLNPLGNQLMALCILKTLGLNPTQTQKARNSWLDRTDVCETRASMSLRQYQQLDALAAKQNRPTAELLGELVSKALSAGANHQ